MYWTSILQNNIWHVLNYDQTRRQLRHTVHWYHYHRRPTLQHPQCQCQCQASRQVDTYPHSLNLIVLNHHHKGKPYTSACLISITYHHPQCQVNVNVNVIVNANVKRLDRLSQWPPHLSALTQSQSSRPGNFLLQKQTEKSSSLFQNVKKVLNFLQICEKCHHLFKNCLYLANTKLRKSLIC